MRGIAKHKFSLFDGMKKKTLKETVKYEIGGVRFVTSFPTC